MKNFRFTWLVAALLPLSGPVLAQSATFATSALLPASTTRLPASSVRPVLGGPPQPLLAAVAELAEPEDLARLQQLVLPASGQPTQLLQPAELARVFPQCVRPLARFRPDIAALATATLVGTRGELLALTLPLGSAGVPAAGAAAGQCLELLTSAGEQVVLVARPAAAGSRTLTVSGGGSSLGRVVWVVGLEHPAEAAVDYEALAALSLRTTQQLAQQLASVQQQLAALRSQVAATQRLNGELLLDHAEQAELRQQLHLLQSQQAATFSAGRPRRALGWAAD